MNLEKSPIHLHVGFPKTATTWLQHHLQESPNIHYVGKYYGVNDRWASSVFKEIWYSLKGLGEPVNIELVQQALELVAGNSPEKPIVFSDEVLAKPWKGDPDWSDKFAKRLYNYFPEAKVLLTLRNQSDIACSLYRKYVGAYGFSARPMREWLESGAGSTDVDFWSRWELLGLYRSLYKHFGENLTVLPYERIKHDTHAYCNDVADFFGLQQNELVFQRKLNKPEFNTDYQMLLKSIMNPRLWAEVRKNIKVKPKYDEMLLTDIKHYYEKSNRNLARLCRLNLDDYGYFL